LARSSVSDEEIQLRKRARRRLVGAVALVIVAVAAVPLLLDSEPRSEMPAPRVTMPDQPADVSPQRPVTIESPAPAPGSADLAQASPIPETPSPPVPEVPASAQPESPVPDASPPPALDQGRAAPPQEGTVEKPKPARTEPAATGKSSYVVQLIATTSPDKARELKRRLQSEKFPVYTEKTPDGGKIRVRVGPFPRHESAEAARIRLVKLGFDPGKVVAKGE